MNYRGIAFQQLFQLLIRSYFIKCEKKHKESKSLKVFGCWKQISDMIIDQFTVLLRYRRNCSVYLTMNQKKIYFSTIPGTIFILVNNRIFYDIFRNLPHTFHRQLFSKRTYHKTKYGNSFYSFDDSMNDFYLNILSHTDFEKKKVNVQTCIELDPSGYIHIFVIILIVNTHEMINIKKNLKGKMVLSFLGKRQNAIYLRMWIARAIFQFLILSSREAWTFGMSIVALPEMLFLKKNIWICINNHKTNLGYDCLWSKANGY